MTINRDQVAHYLDSQFSSLAAAVAQSDDTDGDSGYGADIDNALRKLGKAESELEAATVANEDRDALYALAEYFAARRFWRLLGNRVNTSTGRTSYNFAHQLDHVKAMMDEAKAQCVALGYDVTGSGWSVGWMNQDWLEAETEYGI